jgi:hypothetical protein
MDMNASLLRRIAKVLTERLVLAVEVFIKRPGVPYAVEPSSYDDAIESSSRLVQR